MYIYIYIFIYLFICIYLSIRLFLYIDLYYIYIASLPFALLRKVDMYVQLILGVLITFEVAAAAKAERHDSLQSGIAERF